MLVEKSDIDQLVLGYVAEERYFQTRNELFRESPNLPEKVPILSVFGDISSENRLQTILQEYVQFKTRQLIPMCAACEDCDSLPDMWKVFDRIVTKIRNHKPPEPPPPPPPLPTSAPTEMRCYSPSYVWQGTSAGKSNRAGDNSVPTETVQRMKLNHLSSEYESEPSDIRKNTAGSAKRKKSTIPKKITNPVPEITEPYAHNGDLSMLLQTYGRNDALALVGVKILSNMKKCADKGSNVLCNKSSNSLTVSQPAEPPVSPLKSSYGNALDIEDLISGETRSGLVEMTIDSLLNPDVPDGTVLLPQDAKASSSIFNEDFSELRRLIEFEDTNSSNLTLPDLIQIQQDEQDLIEIIKSDENLEIPANPAPLEYDSSQSESQHSQDEKHAIAGLLAIQGSTGADISNSPAIIAESCGEGRLTCTTPKILNVRSENEAVAMIPESCSDQTIDSAGKNREAMSVFSKSSALQAVELSENCASMPPKKRFLVKETRTPEKCSTPTSENMKDCQGEETQNKKNLDDNSGLRDIISTAASLSNLELSFSVADTSESSLQIVTSPEPTQSQSIDADLVNAGITEKHFEQRDSNDDFSVSSSEADAVQVSVDPELRRSKRLSRPNLALKDGICKPVLASSNAKNSPSVTPKKKPSSASKKKIPTKSRRSPEKDSPKVKVMKPGQGPVVIKLKDGGRMPVAVSGIVVRSSEHDKLSKDDIINKLVTQVQKGKSKSSKHITASPEKPACTETLKSSKGQNSSENTGGASTVRELIVPEIRIQAPTPQPPAILNTEDAGPSSLLEAPPNTSDSNNSCSAATSETPAISNDLPPPVVVPGLVSQTLAASSYMPISEDSIMAALDMPFLSQGDKVDTETFPNTPSKTDLQHFTTISPGGIFSVVAEASPVTLQMTSAKSNLFKSFLEEENAEGTVAESSVVSSNTATGESAHHVTTSDISTTNNTDSIAPVKNIPVMSTPVVGSKQADHSKTKSVPSLLKRNTGKAKSDLGKQPILHKRPRGGILMCSKMKNMVRIEPKRHGVPAVKRYIVQSGQEGIEQSNADSSVELPQDCSTGSIMRKDSESTAESTIHPSGLVDQGCEKLTSVKIKHKPESIIATEGNSRRDEECSAIVSTQEKEHKIEHTSKKSKRKSSNKSRDRKRSKRLKLSHDGGPVMKWTYNEIQSKLDAIHGKKGSDSGTKSRISSSKRDDETEGENTVIRNSENCHEMQTSLCETEQINKQHSETDIIPQGGPRGVDCSTRPICPSDTATNSENACHSVEKPVEPRICDAPQILNPDLPTTRLTDKASELLNAEGNAADSVLNIPDESLWLPFNVEQIEPLDLSLTSWLCNSKSPFKNYSVAVASSRESSCLVQKESEAKDKDTSTREPLKEVPCANSKTQKPSKKKKSSKKFKRLEEKLKKVDLRNMDISKFLDSLDYHET